MTTNDDDDDDDEGDTLLSRLWPLQSTPTTTKFVLTIFSRVCTCQHCSHISQRTVYIALACPLALPNMHLILIWFCLL